MSHSTRGRSSMLVAGRRVQPAGGGPPIRKEKVGEGGKVGWAGGSLPQEASPFVAALATLRGSGAGDRPNLGRNTWEGEESRTHNPSHPIPPARQPVHAPHPSQPANSPSDQPASPRFLFPRIRASEGPTRSSLRRPCLSLRRSVLPVILERLFSFPLFAISYLACIQYLHCIRVDCFTFACAQFCQARRLLSAHTLTHRIASRLPIRPLFARPTQ